MDQFGPGGHGYPKINENMNKYLKTKRKKTNEGNLCFEMWGEILKNGRAQRLGVYCGIIKKRD